MVVAKLNLSPHLGVGLYSMPDAARLLSIHPAKLRRWVMQDSPLVSRRLPEEERILTFAELMELYFIRMFREEGVSMQAIRKASKTASERFSTEYPFSVKRFDTDGRTIFATMILEEQDEVIVEDLRRGQYVFDQIVKPFFRKLEFRGTQDVVRFWPMEKKGLVVLDPMRKFGKPIDSKSGIPTRAIYDAVHAGTGQTQRDVANWFGIPERAVRAAMAFEKSLAG